MVRHVWLVPLAEGRVRVEVRLCPSPLGIVVVHERMEAPVVARLQKVAELVDDDALQAGVGAKA